MGKSKSKKDNGGGGGIVTATQVAFIVDRYLSDNNFLSTLSAFRSEASSLLPPVSPIANQSAKSLLKLGDMLDGYIRLKAEKILLDEEKTHLEHEKSRIHNLLRGMQHVMNAYNAAASPLLPIPTPAPVYNSISRGGVGPSSNSITQQQEDTLKRRNNSKHATALPLLPSKRSRTKSTCSASSRPVLNNPPPPPVSSKTSPPLRSSSSVVKCLFNSSPQTPSPSPTDKKLVSPTTHHTTNRTTVITSETIQVSPTKQLSYYSIERNHHCISSPMKSTSKRFTANKDHHVKGRLDFDASSSDIVHSNSAPGDENSGGSPSQDHGFDFDLPNLDCLAGDFNFSDLLGDFDLDGFCPTNNVVGSSPECLSGSPDKMLDGSSGHHELLSGMSSTFTEFQSDQDMNNVSGPNLVTSVKSVRL